MTTPSTPPSGFLDWLRSNFGPVVTIAVAVGTAAIGYIDLRRDVGSHETRLDAHDTQFGITSTRLAQQDVLEASTRAQIDRLEELMTEVRDDVRQMNRRTQ